MQNGDARRTLQDRAGQLPEAAPGDPRQAAA